MEELKHSETQKEEQLESMIEDEKRKRLQEIIEERKKEEERKEQEKERMRHVQMEQEMKRLTVPVEVKAVQYAEENLTEWWEQKVFSSTNIHTGLFTKLFTPASP